MPGLHVGGGAKRLSGRWTVGTTVTTQTPAFPFPKNPPSLL